MEWFEPKKSGGNNSGWEPSCAAIMLGFSKREGQIERVRIRLSAEFVKQARLQSGDKLQAGIDDEGCLCLRRHPAGNAISGVGFSVGKSAGNSGRPHVAYQAGSYPRVMDWASHQTPGAWLLAVDSGTHFQIG
jgi:hypothetical protein